MKNQIATFGDPKVAKNSRAVHCLYCLIVKDNNGLENSPPVGGFGLALY
ncbi:MAG TPA: hypothetical protein VFX86_01390 [Candidatus Saccharimonadales bacterium]|nr:hypothetical protein [Candidatus Saccharimonadales bacterium]